MTDECEVTQTGRGTFRYRVKGEPKDFGPFKSQGAAEDHIRKTHPSIRKWHVALLANPK